MTSAVLDSTIVIDHLNGIHQATAAIAGEPSPAISVVTWIEVMVGLRNADEERAGREYLAQFEVVALSEPVAEGAVRLRRETRLKLPDAIILATARHLHCPLLTRNTRDFGQFEREIVVPYSV